MTIEFDKNKSDKNLQERGFGFEIVENMEIIKIIEDTRNDYSEPRYRAFGYIEKLAYALVFTPRNGNMRVISLRRMHKKEIEKNDLT